MSFNYDGYNEELFLPSNLSPLTSNLNRWEVTPGVFAEYTYTYKDKLTLLAGIREDYSTHYGFFTTPRMNVRYAPFEWWTLRGSVGLGYRTPNAIADNAAFLSSNREFSQFLPTDELTVLGTMNLAQERSMNTGISTVFYIPMGKRELQLSGEYYYTKFLDGVIADMDRNLQGITLYNMHDVDGAQYFSHNWQVEATMEILRGWTMTAAFRYTDVKQTTFNTTANKCLLRDKPLQNKFKGIITTSYQTPLKTWQFDLTAQFNGPGRMPDGFKIPSGSNQYFTDEFGQIHHKWYPQLLGQVTKFFRTWSIYLGAENMTNFTQDNPIVGSTVEHNGHHLIDPSSPTYDASMIWAPIHGWKLYLGFRWSLEREE